MKNIVKIIILILFVLLLRKGYSLTKKYIHATKHVKFGLDSFKFITPIDLSNLNITKEIAIGIQVQNFSPSTFIIQQVNIDTYTESGELIAYQKAPITEPIEIIPDKNNVVTINYLLEPSGIRQLIKSAGGILKVSANYITTGKYGITLHLKGFVKSEGLRIRVNQKLTF